MIVWAKVAGIVAAFIFAVVIGWHFGRLSIELADAKVEVKQQVAEQKKTTADASIIAQEAKAYEAADLDPIPAPVVRLCVAAPAASVPSAHAAGPGTHAPAPASVADSVPGVPGPDIGSALLRAAHRADSQVMQLQDYISHVCQAKVP